jgi:hypothetical protein
MEVAAGLQRRLAHLGAAEIIADRGDGPRQPGALQQLEVGGQGGDGGGRPKARPARSELR